MVAVSRLEVLAQKAGLPSAALDAHRHEIFLRIGESAKEMLAGAPELAAVNPAPKRIAICDEAAVTMLAAAWPGTELVRTPAPTAADALLFGAARVDAGVFVDLALLDGHYLRRSDAEIFGEETKAAEENAKSEAVMCVCPMAGAWVNEVMEIAGSLKGLPQWTRENYLTALDPDAVPRRIALMVLGPDEDRMTGFLVARLLPPQAELEIIAVDARVQRRGLARKLFDELVYKLGQAGVTEVILEVRASNQAALAFYRVLGFDETGRRPRYYADPQEDAVLMKLQLA